MDRQREADVFRDADEANARAQARHAMDAAQRARHGRRGAEPLPEGGLFDEVRRNQKELF